MYFNSELTIKGEYALKMSEIKAKYSFTYIDIFLYSILLGIDNKSYVNKYSDNDNSIEETASIPRSVLINSQEILNNIFAIAVLKSNENNINEDILKIAFEDKDDDYKTFEKFKCSFNYALGGINILYTMLIPNDGVVKDEITILNGILDKYKGV